MKERYRPIGEVAKWSLFTTAIIAIANGAFSLPTKRKIWERAEGVSEISGRSDMKLECAHINHDRDSGYYDEPENGLLVTTYEHLYDPEVGHLPQRYQQVDSRGLLPNGLKPEHNEFAIDKLLSRLPKKYNGGQIELALVDGD